MEKRLADLKEQLKNHNLEDQPQETEINLLKRQAVRESEQHKWEAIREVCFVVNRRFSTKMPSSLARNSSFSRKRRRLVRLPSLAARLPLICPYE